MTEVDIRTAHLAQALNRIQMHEEQMAHLLDLSQRAQYLSEQEVCNVVIDLAVKITNSRIGYLHMVDDDQDTVSLVAWNAEALTYCSSAHVSHYPLTDAGIWADCARERRPVVHNDYQNMAGKKTCPEGHTHLIRHLSVPVLDGDKVLMIVGVGEGTSTRQRS